MHHVIHIHREAAPKPAWGEPCNGCGVCCAMEPCPVGAVVSWKRHGRCKALQWNERESRYRCGVVNEPQRFIKPRWLATIVSSIALRMIAAGKGCDCDVAAEPQG